MPWTNLCNDLTYLSMAYLFRFTPYSSLLIAPPLLHRKLPYPNCKPPLLPFRCPLLALSLPISKAEGAYDGFSVYADSVILRTPLLFR
jgi:hypothetical protein